MGDGVNQDGVNQDTKTLGVKNWKNAALEKHEWTLIPKKAKVNHIRPTSYTFSSLPSGQQLNISLIMTKKYKLHGVSSVI